MLDLRRVQLRGHAAVAPALLLEAAADVPERELLLPLHRQVALRRRLPGAGGPRDAGAGDGRERDPAEVPAVPRQNPRPLPLHDLGSN